MKSYDTHCPKCGREECLAVAVDAVMVNPGPEGPLYVIGCTICGWNRPSVHYKGIHQYAQLRTIIKVSGREATESHISMMEKNIGRFSHDQSV